MIRSLAVASLATVSLLAACGDDKPATPAAPAATGAPAPASAAPAAPATDLSSPLRALNAFIAGAKAKDKDAMIRCIASGAESELRKLRNKTASDKEWTEWMDGMAAATIGEIKTEGDDRATAVITVGGRRDQVKLVRDGANWLLMGM